MRYELTQLHQQVCEELHQEIQQLREQINDAGNKENDLKARLNKITQLEEEVQHLLSDKRKLEQELYSAKTTQEDQEVRIRMAHQHLGKKVKETAILNEKNEEQRKLIVELQSTLEHTKARNEELNYSLEQQLQHEKRHQERIQEVMKSAEAQVLKWEEKYFHLCDKWQETEAQNRELKIIEEKHYQLQNMLLNMNAVMGTFNPASSTSQQIQLKSSAMFSPLPQNTVQSPAIEMVEPSSMAHQDLFDYSKAFKPTKP
jgi:chromosome segregation ATPase